MTSVGRRPQRAFLAAWVAVALVLGAQLATVLSPAMTIAASCSASLQALLDATRAGGMVTVPPCTYRESVTVPRPMTMEAAGAVVDGENRRSRGITIREDDVTINGIVSK